MSYSRLQASYSLQTNPYRNTAYNWADFLIRQCTITDKVESNPYLKFHLHESRSPGYGGRVRGGHHLSSTNGYISPRCALLLISTVGAARSMAEGIIMSRTKPLATWRGRASFFSGEWCVQSSFEYCLRVSNFMTYEPYFQAA